MKAIVTLLFATLFTAVISTPIALGQEDTATTLHSAWPITPPSNPPSNQIPQVDILETFDAPGRGPAGIGWDGTNFWLVANTDKLIFKLEPGTMAVLDSFAPPAASFAFGLDHDGTDLWGDTNEPDQIYRADDTTGVVSDSYASPFTSPNGVAWEGAALWHSAFLQDLSLIDPSDGSVIRTIPSPGNRTPRGLEWVDGALWVVDANLEPEDGIYQIDPSDGTILQRMQIAGATYPFGLAFDGEYFWMTDYLADKIYKVDLMNFLLADDFESGDTSAWSSTVQ